MQTQDFCLYKKRNILYVVQLWSIWILEEQRFISNHPLLCFCSSTAHLKELLHPKNYVTYERKASSNNFQQIFELREDDCMKQILE